MCLPPNCTALLQPLDQNVINLIKLNYKKGLLEDLLATEVRDFDTMLKAFDLRKAVRLLAYAWEKVPTSTIEKSWNILFADPNNEWTNADNLPLSTLRDEIILENATISSMAGLLQIMQPEQTFSHSDVHEWVSELPEISHDLSDGNETSDNEIVDENVAEEQDVCIKTEDAIKSINTTIQWAEENNICLSQILTLQEIKEAAMAKKLKSKPKQTQISNYFQKL